MTPQTVQYKELSESGNHDRKFVNRPGFPGDSNS